VGNQANVFWFVQLIVFDCNREDCQCAHVTPLILQKIYAGYRPRQPSQTTAAHSCATSARLLRSCSGSSRVRRLWIGSAPCLLPLRLTSHQRHPRLLLRLPILAHVLVLLAYTSRQSKIDGEKRCPPFQLPEAPL
jgi:hypothetical protein